MLFKRGLSSHFRMLCRLIISGVGISYLPFLTLLPCSSFRSILMAAVDWCQLPKELLHLITERLDCPLCLLRFRSVCSAWRSSATSPFVPSPNFPSTFPPTSDDNASTFSLSKRTLLLINPPPHTESQTPWFVKIGQDSTGQTRLYHALCDNPRLPSPSSPCLLDLNNLPVSHLGNNFVLLLDHSPPRSSRSVVINVKKVAVTATSLLAIYGCWKLILFRSGDDDDDRWTIIPSMPKPYNDVCVFKGRHCAVDRVGRTFAVGSDSSLNLIAQPVFGGQKKFLVESHDVDGGSLLLVDCFLRHRWKTVVKFDVYSLEEKEMRWVKVTSLGDLVLFLGDDCTFSASASDLRLGRGDCVVFSDDALDRGMGVFTLDVGQISGLSNYPDYARLFWPAPDWVRMPCH